MSVQPITIFQSAPRQGSTSFFDWPTDSITLCSPASSFLPDVASPSSSVESDSPLSPLDADNAPLAVHHSLSWHTAAAETAAGIHYLVEQFPAAGQTVLGPPFRSEPLQVAAGTRVRLLDEVGEHAVRVCVVETGQTGLLPVWIIEDALERLARLNTEFNEAATCPKEHTGPRSTRSAAAISHNHERCVPFATRRVYGLDDDEDDDTDEYFEYTEKGKGGASSCAVYEVHPSPHRRRKSVEFARIERPTVFRYPSAALIEAYYGSGDEETVEDDEQAPQEDEWWWAGWEEAKEDAYDEMDVLFREYERMDTSR